MCVCAGVDPLCSEVVYCARGVLDLSYNCVMWEIQGGGGGNFIY